GPLRALDQFLGRAGAAEHVARLQHQHPLAAAGEVVGGDEAVVAGADHDRVVVAHVRGGIGVAKRVRTPSPSISFSKPSIAGPIAARPSRTFSHSAQLRTVITSTMSKAGALGSRRVTA